ncbi:MAG: DUF1707 SHOCT-like domain-containing protein [Janthinobacterium lividum]
MTDQLPGRTPPWTTGAWISPARPQPQPVRIGDAERDAALDKLADHFAAGRLTRDELDERTDKAMGARFDSDLDALFRDLPERSRDVVARRSPPRATAVLPAAVMALVPLLVLVAVASVVLHIPVLIGPLVWMLLLSGMGRRHHYR